MKIDVQLCRVSFVRERLLLLLTCSVTRSPIQNRPFFIRTGNWNLLEKYAERWTKSMRCRRRRPRPRCWWHFRTQEHFSLFLFSSVTHSSMFVSCSNSLAQFLSPSHSPSHSLSFRFPFDDINKSKHFHYSEWLICCARDSHSWISSQRMIIYVIHAFCTPMIQCFVKCSQIKDISGCRLSLELTNLNSNLILNRIWKRKKKRETETITGKIPAYSYINKTNVWTDRTHCYVFVWASAMQVPL